MSDSRHLESASGRPVGIFRSLQVIASSTARLAVVTAEGAAFAAEKGFGATGKGFEALDHLAEWGEVEAAAARDVGIIRVTGKKAAAMRELYSDFPELEPETQSSEQS